MRTLQCRPYKLSVPDSRSRTHDRGVPSETLKLSIKMPERFCGVAYGLCARDN
jgi:hypothetical protein